MGLSFLPNAHCRFFLFYFGRVLREEVIFAEEQSPEEQSPWTHAHNPKLSVTQIRIESGRVYIVK